MASLIFSVALLVMVGVCFAAEQGDSVSVEEPDSLSVEGSGVRGTGGASDQAASGHDEEGEDDLDDQSAGRGEKRRMEGPGAWFWNTHPNYEMSITKKKDVTDWNTEIALNRKLSDRLRLNLNATLNTHENSTLGRSDSRDGTSANLTYTLNDDIKFSLVYNSTVSAFRYGEKEEVRDRKKREDLSVSSDLTKSLSDAVEVNVKVVAGSTENSFASVRNQGGRQNISASISYAPSEDLSASVDYTGKRLNLNSAIDSGEVAVFTSRDKTLLQSLKMRVGYDVAPGIKLNLDAGRDENHKQHPEPKTKLQETERRSARMASISSDFSIFQRFTWDVSVNFSESDMRFEVQENKDNSSANSSLNAGAKLLPWRGATLNVGGQREITRSEYQTADSGEDVHKSLTLKYSQDLGETLDLSLTALSDMVSVFYDDKQANPKDRDKVSNKISTDINCTFLDKISTRLGGEYSRDKTVYVDSKSSANNRSTRKYRVSGKYDFTTFYEIDISQNYQMSSVYTFYEFGEDNNTLVRNSSIQTKLGVPIVKGLKVNLSHNYKFQDQGSYREENGRRLYGRADETESHVFNIGLNYRIRKVVKLLVRQSYYISRNWDYGNDGEKRLDSETTSTDIMGRMGFDYNVGENTKISLSIEQVRKEGTRVNRDFTSYRNITFEASHVF